VLLPTGMPVTKAILFDGKARFFTKEIEIVNAFGMLPVEFVTGETPVTQPAPHEFFRPGLLFADCASTLGVGHDQKVNAAAKK